MQLLTTCTASFAYGANDIAWTLTIPIAVTIAGILVSLVLNDLHFSEAIKLARSGAFVHMQEDRRDLGCSVQKRYLLRGRETRSLYASNMGTETVSFRRIMCIIFLQSLCVVAVLTTVNFCIHLCTILQTYTV